MCLLIPRFWTGHYRTLYRFMAQTRPKVGRITVINPILLTCLLTTASYYWYYSAQLSELKTEGFVVLHLVPWPGWWQASYYGTRWYSRQGEKTRDNLFSFDTFIHTGLLFWGPLLVWVIHLSSSVHIAEVPPPLWKPRSQLPLIRAGPSTCWHSQRLQVPDPIAHSCHRTLWTTETHPRSDSTARKRTIKL